MSLRDEMREAAWYVGGGTVPPFVVDRIADACAEVAERRIAELEAKLRKATRPDDVIPVEEHR